MIRARHLLTAVVCLASPCLGEGEARAEIVSLEELVRDLGDDRFPVRVRASHELWTRGEEAAAALREVVGSDRPEVAIRAGEVLRKIELGILPDSPPQVVQLVMEYDRASPDQRVRIIGRLKELGAWRQLLKIHELERDPETLVKIAPEIRGVSVAAARELLAGDEPDFDEARKFLEMGRPEPEQLISLADFHRVNGTLDEELDRAGALRGEAGHLWRYALLAADGRHLEAAREADALEMTLTAARLRLLAGDPVPWVRHAPVPEGQIPPLSLDAYRKAVENLWAGRPPSERLARALAEGVKHDLDDESWHSLSVLYALGLHRDADPRFTRLSPVAAFAHFETTERLDEALEALGLDPREPDFAELIDRDFRSYFRNPDDAEAEAARLHALAGFLEARGMKRELLDHYVAPLEHLGREDPERFIEMLGEMFSPYRRLPVATPTIPAVVSFAGDDEDRWQLALSTMFGEADTVGAIRDSFEEFRPGMSPRQRLELLAALLGRIPDEGGVSDDWWAWIEKRAAAAEGIDRRADFRTMLVLSVRNTDARRFLDVIAKVRDAGIDPSELGGEYRFSGFEVLCLGALGRWDEVVGHWRKRTAALPRDPVSHAYLAGALMRAGLPDEAAEAAARADRLALGDTGIMRRIGQAYASTGEFELAAEWWLRAAGQSIDDDPEFYYACILLHEEAKFSGEWPLAAALGELYLMRLVMMGDSAENPLPLVRARAEVEISRALSRLGDDREGAIKALGECRRQSLSDGSMADYFFPAMRAAGLGKLHDEWFEETWKAYMRVIARFPGSHNTMNTAAWTASRANRRLDEAGDLIRRALDLMPRQAAYLDTYGEIWFARGDRGKAVEWSTLSLVREPAEEGLLRQHARFARGPFPAK